MGPCWRPFHIRGAGDPVARQVCGCWKGCNCHPLHVLRPCGLGAGQGGPSPKPSRLLQVWGTAVVGVRHTCSCGCQWPVNGVLDGWEREGCCEGTRYCAGGRLTAPITLLPHSIKPLPPLTLLPLSLPQGPTDSHAYSLALLCCSLLLRPVHYRCWRRWVLTHRAAGTWTRTAPSPTTSPTLRPRKPWLLLWRQSRRQVGGLHELYSV